MSTLIIISAAVLFSGLAYYCYVEDIRQLHQFRADIRPGDCVRIRTENGLVHARILKRENSLTVVAVETHTRKQILIPLTFIYQP